MPVSTTIVQPEATPSRNHCYNKLFQNDVKMGPERAIKFSKFQHQSLARGNMDSLNLHFQNMPRILQKTDLDQGGYSWMLLGPSTVL